MTLIFLFKIVQPHFFYLSEFLSHVHFNTFYQYKCQSVNPEMFQVKDGQKDTENMRFLWRQKEDEKWQNERSEMGHVI